MMKTEGIGIKFGYEFAKANEGVGRLGETVDRPLNGYRCLELADEKGFFCGSLLGGLGVDVIKVERPGGDSSRNIPPYYQDVKDPEKSLYWFAYNINKRGITLNIESETGQEIFRKLVKTADFVIESFPPGYMDEIGLGYQSLSQVNPRIIMTSITHFGQSGPHRDYKGSDLVDMAMGGVLYVNGTRQRPPVRITFPQIQLHGGIHAAVGTLIAHQYARRTGKGQHVDISLQECALRLLYLEFAWWEYDRYMKRREGAYTRRGSVLWRVNWPCKDGQLAFRLLVGPYGHQVRALVELMKSKQAAGMLEDVEWEAVDMTKLTQEEADSWDKVFADFFLQCTTEEIYKQAIRNHIPLAPSHNAKQILEDEQLRFRNYWVDVPHPELNTSITYPGAPYKFSESPWQVYRRAPLIGEHNSEIYGEELQFSRQEIVALSQSGII